MQCFLTNYPDHHRQMAMITCCMRALEWGFVQKPLWRLPVKDLRPAGSYPGEAIEHRNGHANGHVNELTKQKFEQSVTVTQAMWDAFDLIFNLRGYGWNWTKNWYFPTETRSTTSTPSFLMSTLFSACKYYIIFDLCLTTARVISPPDASKLTGGSIFDPSLPPALYYTIPCILTLICGMTVCASIQLIYDVLTIISVVVLQQHPVQWPPIADHPWLSTSLTLCWSKRWHQLFRSSFIGVGARPLSWLFGRVGGVVGAFFWSAILHDWGMWGLGHGTEFSHVGGFFLMMGVGCIMETLFKKVTGVKVRGLAGWVWTMCWMIGWGIPMIDAWTRRGLLANKFVPEEYMIGHFILRFGSNPL